MDSRSPNGSGMWLRLWQQLKMRFRFKGRMPEPTGSVFRIGDRVEDFWGRKGTVINVDSLANPPLGVLHVLYDHGGESKTALEASGFHLIESSALDRCNAPTSACARRGERLSYVELTQRYGNDHVPVSKVYEVFEEVAGAELNTFIRLAPGLFARWATSEITQIINVYPVKGLGVSLHWGVGLTWVPDIRRGRMHWRRTLRSIPLSLFEDITSLAKPGMSVADKETLSAERGHGPIYLRETMSTMWKRWNADVLGWFNHVKSPEEIRSAAERQVSGGWHYAIHYPRPLFVLSFTLARMGLLEEARSKLSEVITNNETLCGLESILADALQVAMRPRPAVSERRNS